MAKKNSDVCSHCLGTGQFWNGEEVEDCGYCDGESTIENFDAIIDLDELIEPPDPYNDEMDE